MHKHDFYINNEGIGDERCACGVRRDSMPNHHLYRVYLLERHVKIDAAIGDMVFQMNVERVPTFSTCQGGCLDMRGDDSLRGLQDAVHFALEENTYLDGFVAVRGDFVKKAPSIMSNYVKVTEVEYPYNGNNVTRVTFTAPDPCAGCLQNAIDYLEEAGRAQVA